MSVTLGCKTHICACAVRVADLASTISPIFATLVGGTLSGAFAPAVNVCLAAIPDTVEAGWLYRKRGRKFAQ
jgi:hypothetical protein